MTTPYNDRIRQEFYIKIAEFSDGNRHVEPYSMQKIADFFLSKFDEKIAEVEGLKINQRKLDPDRNKMTIIRNRGFNSAVIAALNILKK